MTIEAKVDCDSAPAAVIPGESSSNYRESRRREKGGGPFALSVFAKTKIMLRMRMSFQCVHLFREIAASSKQSGKCCIRELPDMMSTSEGDRGHGKADLVREVA